MAADLVIHGGTPLPLAMQATVSMAREFFATESFADYKKGLEGQRKTTEGLFALIGGVQKAIVHLAKIMARR